MRQCPICKKNPVTTRFAYFCDVCRLLCSRCRTNPRMKGQRHCAPCKATITRERYRLLGVGRALSENEAKANRARGYARSYIKRGLLQKQPCEIPGCECPSMMYHKDFGQPLEVTWMCKGHALEFGLAGPDRQDPSKVSHHQEPDRSSCDL